MLLLDFDQRDEPSLGLEIKGTDIISKYLFGVIIWTKIATKILKVFLP